jgi:hypothetical protein
LKKTGKKEDLEMNVKKTFKTILKEILSFIALICLLLFALVWINLLMYLTEKFKGTKFEKFLCNVNDWIERVVENTARKCENLGAWFDK